MDNLILEPNGKIIGLRENLSDVEAIAILIQKIDLKDVILKEAKKQGYEILKSVHAYSNPNKENSPLQKLVSKIPKRTLNGPIKKTKVDAYSYCGEKIGSFESQAAASKVTGVLATGVSEACRRKIKFNRNKKGEKITFRYSNDKF